MRRLGANQFSDLAGNPIVFRSANRSMTATLTLQGETYFSGDRVAQIQLSAAALGGFTGNYHSDEFQLFS